MPLISSLLRNSFFTTEYIIGSQVPLVYDGDNWWTTWKLFDQFTLPLLELQHPNGQTRHPPLYRYPLWRLHERLVQELENMGFVPTT